MYISKCVSCTYILIMITLYRHALITIGFAVQRLRVKLTGGEMKFRTLL